MRHVFVSYSHEENDFAQLLRNELHNAGIQTWLVLENLKTGEDWRQGIDDAIREAFAITVIISPSSNQSKYVTYEWAFAHGLNIPIIPVLYRRTEALHPRLETLQYEDFTSSTVRPWGNLITRLHEIINLAIDKEKQDPKITQAIQALNSWDFTVIVKAADMLGQRRIQSAIPQLISLLDEPNVEVQKAAIRALGEISTPLPVEKIIGFVNKNQLRLDAIRALGKIGDTRAEEILIQQAKAGDFEVILEAILALENISTPLVKQCLFELLENEDQFDRDAWDDDLFGEWNSDLIISRIFHSLSNKINDDDVPNLLKCLKMQNKLIVQGTLRLLSELTNETTKIPILLQLRNTTESTKNKVLSALEKFEGLSNIRTELDKLNSDDEKQQEDVINFFYEHFSLEGLIFILAYHPSKIFWEISNKIEEVTNKEDLPRLIEALHDPEVRVKGLVADVFRRKQLDGGKVLKSLINDKSSFVRGLAIRAIGDLKISGVLSRLKSRLKDSERIYSNSMAEVKDYAAIALAKLGQKEAIPRLQELCLNIEMSYSEEASELLISLGKISDKSIFEKALYDEDPKRRIRALKVLGAIEKNIDVAGLITDLQEDEFEKRKSAILQLKNLYSPSSLIILLAQNHLGNGYWEIAKELEGIIQPEHSNFVSRFLSDNHYRTKAFLAEIIGNRPDLGWGEHLIKLIDDESDFVRGLAIRSVGRLKYISAKDSLKNRLTDTGTVYGNSKVRVCDYSAIALAKIGEIKSDYLLEAFKFAPNEFSEELANLLIRELGENEAINQMLSFLMEDNYSLRQSAKSILSKIGGAKLVLKLFELLTEADKQDKYQDVILSLIGEFGTSQDASRLLDFFSVATHKNWISIKETVEQLADESIRGKALSLLDNEDEEIRMVCLEILKKYVDQEVVEKILILLRQENRELVIFRAINVLAQSSNQNLLEVISSFAHFESDVVKRSVVQAYGKFLDKEKLSWLFPFLEDEYFLVRSTAVEVLMELGDSTNLKMILKNMDVWNEVETYDFFFTEFNVNCIKAIGTFGDNSNLEMLQQIVQSHKEADYRAAALIAFCNIDNKLSVNILIDKLADDGYSYFHEETICNIAAAQLNNIDDPVARNALNNWLAQLPEEDKPYFFINPGNN